MKVEHFLDYAQDGLTLLDSNCCFYRRQVNVKSLMKKLTLHMIVIKL